MSVVTFNDTEIKKKPTLFKPKIITFEDILSIIPKEEIKKEYGEIKRAPSLLSRLGISTQRKGILGTKALIGDIPFIRKAIPEKGVWEKTKPFTGVEKVQFPLTRLGRDIGLYALSSGVIGALSKVPAIAKAGWAVSKIPKVGKVIAPFIPEFAKGATFGTVISGTEKPEEIAKSAGQMGALFVAVPLTLKGIGKIARPITARLAKIFKPKLSAIKSKVIDLIGKRYSQIQEGLLDSEVFIKDIEKNLTPLERKIVPFIRERALPKEVRQQLLRNPEIRKRYFSHIKPASEAISQYLDDAHKFLMESYGDDVGFIENFIPHIWNIPKNKQRQVVNWFITRNPHLKKRFIPTLKEGIEKFGLKPKYDDITDILRVYDQYKIKAVANIKFVEGLKDLRFVAGYTDKGKHIVKKLIQRIDKAPDDWVTIDHPTLRRAIGRMVGKETEKKLLLNKIPVKVHPEIAEEIKVILGRPFSGAGVRAIDTINAFAKKMNLSFSLFHHVALTETAAATPTVGKRMLGLWNPVKIYKAIKSGNYGIFEKLPLSKDAVRHGLQIGPIPDVQVGRVRTALANLERITKSIPVIRKVTKGIRSFNTMWDKGLWDYYHTSLKLYGYEGLVQRGLKTHPELSSEIVKKEVAQFVNDTFGGQAWDLLLKSAKWRQAMHWLLLSPDWTLSTLRQAVAPTGAGAVTQLGRTLRAEMGEKFWQKGLIYFYGGMNLLNKAFTEAYTGKGRYMWENAPKHKTHLFIGFNPDGTEKYLRWGKQFRELPEFFDDPIKKIAGKVSPILRTVPQLIGGYTLTGWREKDIAGRPFWSKEAMKGRAKVLGKMAFPYSISGTIRGQHPLGMAFPISKGMTPYGARELFKDAIERKDKNALKEIYASALNNNLDAKNLFKQARLAIKSDITFEFKKEAQKIIEKLKKLGKEKGMVELQRMKESGELTPELSKQLIKILLQQQSIGKQKEKLEMLRQK